MDQASLYAWMAYVTDLVNELKADHASFITLTTAVKTKVNAIIAAAAATGANTASIGAVAATTAAAVATLSNSTNLTLLRS
jgi:hypothetical protein